jgi:Ca-activated chloride channel family protein
MNATIPGVDIAEALAQLHFLRPQWLWALFAVPPLAWAWRWRHALRNPWRGVVDAHLLARLLEAESGSRLRLLAPLLGALALAVALLALAGPSWQRGEQPLWQARTPLVIALDLSGAMQASDLPPSRLAQARAKLQTLLGARAGGEVALLVYADDAYVVAPLTDDAANVALFLDALSPDIMPGDAMAGDGGGDAGARADRAIAQARQLLASAGFARGDILLLGDHADADAIDAARAAAANGYRVSAIGLGTAQGAAWRDPDGRIRKARLDAQSLGALAAAGGGRYTPLARDRGDLDALGVLDPRQSSAVAAGGSKAAIWRDQGYWLLLPLLLLAAFAFRRGAMLGLLAACMLLPFQPARASGAQDWWRRPDQQAHARMQAGVQAYQQGDYARAQALWAPLAGADAAYDRGNALARQGRLREAVAAYDEALRLQPRMDDAIANRKAVLAALKRQAPQGGNQQPDKGQQDKDRQQPPTDAGQDARQPGRQGGQSQGRQGDGSPQAPPKRATTPADAGKQQAADDAQRKRMQQALGRGKPGDAGKASQPAPGETTRQREQRLADEAWLRRVPDDPGGLLRERFLLEYQRRQEQGQ